MHDISAHVQKCFDTPVLLPVQRNPAGGVFAHLGVPQGFGIIPTLFGMQRNVGEPGLRLIAFAVKRHLNMFRYD